MTWSINGSGVVISSTGVVSLTEAADYETLTSYSFYITATDASGNESVTDTFTVTVNNLNDTAPVFISSSTFTVEENQLSVGRVTATDADSDFWLITYSLSGADASALSIGSSSGVLAFNTAPDYETKSSYSVVVTASDEQETNSTEQSVTILITNINDNSPKFISSSTFNVEENQRSLGVVQVEDADNDLITLYLEGDDAGLVTLDSETGALFAKENLNFEQRKEYGIVIQANDGESSTYQDVTINVIDLKEAPIVTAWRDSNYELLDGPNFEVEENMTGNLGAFSPSDEDGDEMSFSISEGFYVAGYDKIYFSEEPDYEKTKSYSPILTLSDGELTSDYQLTITITDLNDESPIFSSPSEFSVNENQRSIGTVIATDADSDSIYYSLSGTDASALSIASSSGVLVFNEAPDYENKRNYSAVVTCE